MSINFKILNSHEWLLKLKKKLISIVLFLYFYKKSFNLRIYYPISNFDRYFLKRSKKNNRHSSIIINLSLFQNIFQPNISQSLKSRGMLRSRASLIVTDLLPLQTQPVLSENLSVVLCFRRVSRGNAAWRSSQATKALLPPPLPVSATLLTNVSWKRRSSFPLRAEKRWTRRELSPVSNPAVSFRGIRLRRRRVYVQSYGGAVTRSEHAKDHKDAGTSIIIAWTNKKKK